MFKKIILILLVVPSVYLFAGEIKVKAKLDEAKIYLQGVELTHSASVSISSIGNHEIVFEGVASNINENTLQVSAEEGVLILSVKSRINYLKDNEKNKEVQSLEDSLKYLNLQKSKQKNEIDVLNMEIGLLHDNSSLTGDEKSITVKELQQFAKYYTERLTEIKNKILIVDMKIIDIDKNINRINNQLNEINRRRSQPSTEIVVNVAAAKTGKHNFYVSYINNNAGWNPVYDIRAGDINSPVILNYKAEVFQNTGLEWKDADLILSTRNPRENGNKPSLYPWYLDFNNIGRYKDGIPEMPMMKSMMKNESAELDVAAAPSIGDYIKINETQLAVEFRAEIKYTIPSDNKRHSIALREYKMPARFEYYAAPKLNSNAFLVAYVDQWKDLNLLPGQANIYFENSFVGQTFIDPFIVDKELAISLGMDKNIVIERKLLKDFTEDKFLSSDVERQFAYEIKVKNNKKSEVKLILEEQYPISKNENIKVELQNSGGAEIDNAKGILKWALQLNPSQDITKQFVYSVRYPADRFIPGL